MKAPKQFTIDGETYTVSPYTTTYGMKLLTEIFLLLGQPLITLAFTFKDAVKTGKNVMDMDVDAAEMVPIISGLTERLNPEQLDSLFKRILENTLIGNTSQSVTSDYDSRFMGKYLHLFKLVGKSMEAQYGDFLGALGGLGKFVPTAKQTS